MLVRAGDNLGQEPDGLRAGDGLGQPVRIAAVVNIPRGDLWYGDDFLAGEPRQLLGAEEVVRPCFVITDFIAAHLGVEAVGEGPPRTERFHVSD